MARTNSKLERMSVCNVSEYDTGERSSNLTIFWENGQRHKARFPASSPEVIVAHLEMLAACIKRDLKEGKLNIEYSIEDIEQEKES